MIKKTGLILAATVGTLFAAASFAADAPAAGAQAGVKCMGANACKGQSACKTATNGCKGQNTCKGMGWIITPTEKECAEKGGKVAS